MMRVINRGAFLRYKMTMIEEKFPLACILLSVVYAAAVNIRLFILLEN